MPGRGVQAVLLRDGQRTTVSVTPRANDAFTLLGDRVRVLQDFGRNFGLEPPVRPAVPAPRATPRAPDVPRMPDIESFIWRGASVLGLTVSDLSAQLADYFGVKDGVLVTSVSEGSGAAKAGVKAGDVVTSVNGSTVSSPSDLRRRVQRLSDGEEFTLGVVRDKKTLTLKGKVEDGRGRRTIRTIV